MGQLFGKKRNKDCCCGGTTTYPCECRFDGTASMLATLVSGGTACSITPTGGTVTTGNSLIDVSVRAWNTEDCAIGMTASVYITAFPPNCVSVTDLARRFILVQKISDATHPDRDDTIVQQYEWYGLVYSDDGGTLLDISYEYSICCKNDTPLNAATSHLIWVEVHNLDIGGPVYDVRLHNPETEASHGTC